MSSTLRLDQEYLRSQPVNSEERAPMGVGIWYEMYISDPVQYLFRNADPRGHDGKCRKRDRSEPRICRSKMMADRYVMSR